MSLLNFPSAANVQVCGKEADMNNSNNQKSNNNVSQIKQSVKQKDMAQKVTILYQRLSVEDDRDAESNSIVNQRILLEDYAERNGFVPYIHIADDGYSGTKWDRPGWQELLAKVEAGEVSVLLVKDSSRLGRDHLRVGLFRELLREKGVRLIAVNDGFDSSKGEDDFTPFRDIMAEWYARDTSRKIKSAFQTKGKRGVPISGKPPYGYKKCSMDKFKWVVDDYAADVVRRIYKLFIAGNSPLQISRILHDDKIEIPSVYLTGKGYVSYRVGHEAKNPYAWCSRSITRLLDKEEYLGHLVNFRSSKPSFKSKKQTFHSKEDWLIFENTHEPIVTQEEWDLVHKLRQTKKRINRHGTVNPMTGLIFCADCEVKMYHSNTNDPRRPSNDRYECSNYNLSLKKFMDVCRSHSITTLALRTILLDVIQKTTSFVRDYEDDFIKLVREHSTLKQGETLKTHTKKIAKNERRIAELDKMFSSLYEDKVQGIITAERFTQMSIGFEKEQDELREENKILQTEVDAFNEDNERVDKFVKLVHKYTRFEELTATIVNEFIDKVVVHESVWSEQTETQKRKGTRFQQVDVYLKYIGNFHAPDIRTPEQIEADRIAEEKLEKRRAYNREYQRRKRTTEVSA
jgi:DNA invertase Pin-like site-specific DNA recombinase